MGTRFLLDTNTAIYYLNGAFHQQAKIALDNILTVECNISVISQIELLGWTPPNNASSVPIQSFVDASIIFPLSQDIVQKTIEIRRAKKIKLPDAIIAATALVHDFEIISRNKSDFYGIAGLICHDPFTEL
jgi:predicted nucleic acid-binding protein